jgi:1-aminocyclopropane-1-carboxylate deaminase/D-cysteine desulfhydrase-like pyridoxal-dependent ACC family enzyme
MMVDDDPFEEITVRLMREAAALLAADVSVSAQDFDLRDLCGPGYAIPSEEGNAAVAILAAQEGLFLDPVYTGKAFGGLVAMAKEGAFKPTDRVLFLHSGGAGAGFEKVRVGGGGEEDRDDTGQGASGSYRLYPRRMLSRGNEEKVPDCVR